MTTGYRGNQVGPATQFVPPSSINYGHLSAAAQAQLAGFRNRIINGNFEIWQRGTSLAAGTTYRFISDRWATEGVVSTVAPSQGVFTLGQIDVPGNPRYYHRAVVASSAGANNYARLTHRAEGVMVLAGQQAMLSFWAKADTSKNIAVEFSQSFGTGGSPSATVTGIGVTTKTLATGWQQFKVPVTIPSIAGKTLGTGEDDFLQVAFWFDAGSTYNARTNSLGQQSGTFDIARVQLEAGADATPFEQRPVGLEFMLCQRYYQRHTVALRTYANGNGAVYSTALLYPVQMRAAPSIALVSAGTVNATVGAANMVEQTFDYARLELSANAAGDMYVTGRVYDFTAEL